MAASPSRPNALFCHFWALTIGSRNAGSAMSALVPAGDLEGHEARRLLEILLGLENVDVLEASGPPEVVHELRHRRGGEGGALDLEGAVAVLESRDPDVRGHRVDEGVGELHGAGLVLRQHRDRLE